MFAPLTKLNVFQYFMLSPFYEKSCNNELLKMQHQYQSVPLTEQEYQQQLMYLSPFRWFYFLFPL